MFQFWSLGFLRALSWFREPQETFTPNQKVSNSRSKNRLLVHYERYSQTFPSSTQRAVSNYRDSCQKGAPGPDNCLMQILTILKAYFPDMTSNSSVSRASSEFLVGTSGRQNKKSGCVQVNGQSFPGWPVPVSFNRVNKAMWPCYASVDQHLVRRIRVEAAQTGYQDVFPLHPEGPLALASSLLSLSSPLSSPHPLQAPHEFNHSPHLCAWPYQIEHCHYCCLHTPSLPLYAPPRFPSSFSFCLCSFLLQNSFIPIPPPIHSPTPKHVHILKHV